nr:MAG TPA: hypothetical protein [Caudoviricetes sp.]DAH92605.1 MAG TPA: hypothetical protein [Bacteriophage sp.]
MILLADSILVSPKRGNMPITNPIGRFYKDEVSFMTIPTPYVQEVPLDYICINEGLNIPLGVLVMTSRGFKPSADLDVGDVLIRYFLDDLPYDAPQKPLRMSEESVKTIKQLKATNSIDVPFNSCIVNSFFLKGY